jgi:hypothetical protein
VVEVPGLTAAGLKTAPPPAANAKVYTAGNALGSGVAVREGVYTSTTPEAWKGQWSFLRFSAPASPGNSGGPLLDEQGRVLGIVTRKSENENLNYALPWSEVDLSPVARVDELYLYGFPLAPDRLPVENHREWPLPLSTEALRAQLVALAREGQGGASVRMREALVPGFEVWNDSRYVTLPGFLEKTETGTWEVGVAADSKSTKIGTNGQLRFADRYGDTVLSLKVPSEARPVTLAQDPKALFDLLLSGYAISRTVGGKSIRILSFGTPAFVKTFEDHSGRVWTLSRFDDPDLDYSELLLWLPTPSGGVGLLKGLSHPTSLGLEVDFEAMADFVLVTHEGTLAQWGDFLDHPELVPRLFRPWSLYWKADQRFALETPDFRWTFGKPTARINDQSLVSVETGYFPASPRPVWGLGSVLYAGEGDYRDYLAFNRSPAPVDQDDQATKNGWKTLLKRGGSFDGVPYDTKERSVVRSVLFPPATSTETVPFAYWQSINAALGDKALLRSRLKGTEESFASPGEAAPGGEAPKVKGATLLDAIRYNDKDLFQQFLSDKTSLGSLDRVGPGPKGLDHARSRSAFGKRHAVPTDPRAHRQRPGQGHRARLDAVAFRRRVAARTGDRRVGRPKGPGRRRDGRRVHRADAGPQAGRRLGGSAQGRRADRAEVQHGLDGHGGCASVWPRSRGSGSPEPRV